MSPAPATTGSFADALYEQLRPLAYADEALGWPLLHYVSGFALPFQLVEDLARDTDDGRPGWAVLLDPDTCPAWALPWLAQLAGVVLDTTLSEADQRAQIVDEAGFRRGTPAALVSAVQARLTGTKTARVLERDDIDYVAGGPDDSAYRLGVLTLASETPDPAAVYQAILSQKPGGIVVTYLVADDSGPESYTGLLIRFGTYDDMLAGAASYDAVEVRDYHYVLLGFDDYDAALAAFASYDALAAGP